MKTLSIVIIGTGNVAQHIAKSITVKKQFKIVHIFNHKKNVQATRFANTLNTTLITDYSKINTEADIYIIAVKDDTIGEVAKNLKSLQLKKLVVHTSGSIDLIELEQASSSIGVYYPLQTFSINDTINWETIPLLIEANTKTGIDLLKKLATTVSKKVKVINSTKRLQLHLAAVFASNFTNALWAAAFSLIEKNISKKDTELLLPLIYKTVSKLEHLSPKEAQTGPAKRNDTRVMNRHVALLDDNKELQLIYNQLSKLIKLQSL